MELLSGVVDVGASNNCHVAEGYEMSIVNLDRKLLIFWEFPC